ncbi:MAG: hypothetical protein ACK5NT_03700 [Pyrinomonadaceae bacterium]
MCELFKNEGFGWYCTACSKKYSASGSVFSSRLLREGEAESNEPNSAIPFPATWLNRATGEVQCNNCKLTAIVEN